jgi:alkylhydroperoxidase family enzyme
MAWDAQARDRQVLGAGERLSLLDEDRLDHRHRAAMDELRVLYGYDADLPLDPFFATLAHSPEFFAGYMALGVAVATRSALPVRLRELAILRTAWLCGAPYAWGEHVHATRGMLLLSAAEIARIVTGSRAPEWGDLDAAVLRAVEELHGEAMIADATWDVLAGHLDERQLLELPILVGHYVMTAYLQNSLRTSLTVHGEGLAAR